MKIFAIVLFAGLVVAGSAQSDVCLKSAGSFCESKQAANPTTDCNAKYKHFEHAVNALNKFANVQLETSYKYMLLAAQFNSFVKDRPGFQTHIKSLSDRSWEAGQDLIKYITKRGGKFTFTVETSNVSLADVNEFQALATVLDHEKNLFSMARHIHHDVSRLKSGHDDKYDPEVAHHIEEKYLASLADSVRKYSGLANDLKNLYGKSKDINMDNYLFDQYMQKI